MSLKIKVCGLNNLKSIEEVTSEYPDYVGLIFYEKSKRYAGALNADQIHIPDSVSKVGVFVNETVDKVISAIEKYDLDLVQLHGDEDVQYLMALKARSNVGIIKVFRVEGADDLKEIGDFEGLCEYFLFDTKGKDYGGNGLKFDHRLIESLELNTPFFLSGGLDVKSLNNLPKNKMLAGVDMNSKLEVSPGIKDQELVKESVKIIRSYE